MLTQKIDIQQKRRNGRWYYICSTSKYSNPKDAVEGFIAQCVNKEVENRVRAVIYGSDVSVAGRDPKGTE